MENVPKKRICNKNKVSSIKMFTKWSHEKPGYRMMYVKSLLQKCLCFDVQNIDVQNIDVHTNGVKGQKDVSMSKIDDWCPLV